MEEPKEIEMMRTDGNRLSFVGREMISGKTYTFGSFDANKVLGYIDYLKSQLKNYTTGD